ncbi:zinc-binding alcohol dehydrogenase family protein [Prolixibacter sp. NT017]|uniref:zinc-binding alcohol dehydrogenase family protein n=1 Tax=Prolixibacter sp. NT017 TaxID=2652390 RepID=UPI00127161CD|nr:zinc-binding alcohol dehydrogenase family protein [Prolixibacter sp. NT017]GET24046.1 sorbitol dehydrogenase [Prolixibacter sp. NT017]
MKTIEIVEPGLISINEREKPIPGTGEILLKVKYVGFCGSDLSSYLGKNPLVSYPRIPGHEISAVIEELGADVPESFLKGQQVTVVPYTNCGQCMACRQKRFNACKNNETLGVQRDGAMAEYISVPWQKVLSEDALNEKQLALVEPLTVGFHAVDNGMVTDWDTVLVIGCGMIGYGAIVRANLRGATVIAADVDDVKLEKAKSAGANYVINSVRQDLHEELMKITRGNGPSVVVEAVGRSETYQAAIQEVSFAGRVVCIGYASDEIQFKTKLWVQKELKIMGARNASPSDFESVIRFLKSGSLNEINLISDIVKPEEAGTAMQKWTENPGKVMKILVRF